MRKFDMIMQIYKHLNDIDYCLGGGVCGAMTKTEHDAHVEAIQYLRQRIGCLICHIPHTDRQWNNLFDSAHPTKEY